MTLLTRHILLEVLKVLLLTCLVLVTVIAFGAAIRPLAQNRIGGFDTLKYVALATVPMLQFALPISAGFAATLVLHRFAVDNEIQAMAASGVSYRRILRPVGLLGGVLVAFMLVLLFAIEPRFWVLLQSTVTRDAARMFVATVEDGRAFDVGGLQIHADEIREIAAPADSGAERRLLLAGVAVVEIDSAGTPTTELTAEQATIDVHRTPEGIFLKPVLGRATIFRALDGTLVELPRAELQAARIDRPFLVKPSVMTLTQMRAVIVEPVTYPLIAETIQGLRGVEQETRAWMLIAQALDAGRGTLVLENPQVRRRFEIRDAVLEGERLVPAEGADAVTITELVSDRRVRAIRCPEVQLAAVRPRVVPINRIGTRGPGSGSSAVAEDDVMVTFDVAPIDAEPVRPVDGGPIEDGDAELLRWPRRLTGLVVGNTAPMPVQAMESVTRFAESVAQAASEAPGPSERLVAQATSYRSELAERLDKLHRDLLAETCGRFARALAALLLPLLGAVLAIWRRSAMPLEVYLISFVPTIVSILLISAGEQLIRSDRTLAGLVTLWSGDGLLAGFLAASWLRMARH